MRLLSAGVFLLIMTQTVFSQAPQYVDDGYVCLGTATRAWHVGKCDAKPITPATVGPTAPGSQTERTRAPWSPVGGIVDWINFSLTNLLRPNYTAPDPPVQRPTEPIVSAPRELPADVRELFLSGARDPISAAMDELIKDGQQGPSSCTEALKYRDGQLLTDLDHATGQYRISQDSIALFKSLKDKLMSDTYWARIPGQDLAREVKFFCDAFSHTLAAITPEGALISSAQELPGIVTRSHVDWLKRVSGTGDIIASVQGGLNDAVINVILEKLGRIGAVAAVLKDVADRAQTATDAQAFRGEYNRQIEALDREISRFDSNAEASGAKLQTLNDAKEAIDRVCNSPIPALAKQ